MLRFTLEPTRRSAFAVAVAALCLPAAARAQDLYVADHQTGVISKIAPDGTVSSFANLGRSSYPNGIAFDARGSLYVSFPAGASGTGKIQKVLPGGFMDNVADFGAGATVGGLAFDTYGNLYATVGKFIEKITASGQISQFAVTGADDPFGLAFDASGNLYQANGGGNTYNKHDTVTKITPRGDVSTFATLTSGSNPFGLTIDANGNLYTGNVATNTISKITPGGTVSTFASGLNYPAALAFGADGNLYAANDNSGVISKIAPNGNVSEFVRGVATGYGLAFQPDATQHTWNGAGAAGYNTWANGANWVGAYAPSAATDNVTFAGTTRLNANLDKSYSVNSLTFAANAGAFVIGNASFAPGATLTVGAGGITQNSTSSLQTIATAGVVLAQSQTWNVATGNLLVSAPISGGGSLTKAGSGTLLLTGANTYTGTTTVNSGALVIQAGTYTGEVTANAGAVSITGGAAGVVSANSGGSVTVGGAANLTAVRLNDTSSAAIGGGTVGYTFGYNGSQTTITDGTVGTASVNDTAILTIKGGSITNAIGNNNSIVNIMGGTIAEVDILDAGTLNMSGGTVTDLFAEGTATLNLSGGTISHDTIYRESAGATVNFFGSSAVVYGMPTAGTDAGGVAGVFYDAMWTLPDGTVDFTRFFDAGGSIANATPRGATYTFQSSATAVPETGTLCLLLPALASAVAYRRRKTAA